MIKDFFHPKHHLPVDMIQPLGKNLIQVLNADMKRTIEDLKKETDVAFAHTISADLEEPRNMSAGVAVVFRTIFGRPQPADYVNNKLTCQTTHEGRNKVYSLVTKQRYFGKPTVADYDEAFLQLTENFKACNLKTLVCSPMGCVRDLIEPRHFIYNLVKFQICTGAKIYIVSYDQQKAKRILMNGLSHSAFVLTLREEIRRYEEIKELQETVAPDQIPSAGPVTPSPIGTLSEVESSVAVLSNTEDFPPMHLSEFNHLQHPCESEVIESLKQSTIQQTDEPTYTSDSAISTEVRDDLPNTPITDRQNAQKSVVTSPTCVSGSGRCSDEVTPPGRSECQMSDGFLDVMLRKVNYM